MSGSTRSAKKKSKLKGLLGKRGYTITVVLAALILVVSIITLSYSWYSPLSQPGTSMNYSADVKVRSENCAILDTKGMDETKYNNKGEWDFTTDISGSKQIPANSIYYFRTVISNNDVQPTNVSLYLKSFPTGNVAKVGLGVASPSNSYIEYTTDNSDTCIVRNAFIYGKNDEKYKDLYIIWFIKTSTDPVTVNVTSKDKTPANNNLYLRYN